MLTITPPKKIKVNEGRIQRLEDAILNAVLIDENTPTDRVRLGSTVTIAEVDLRGRRRNVSHCWPAGS